MSPWFLRLEEIPLSSKSSSLLPRWRLAPPSRKGHRALEWRRGNKRTKQQVLGEAFQTKAQGLKTAHRERWAGPLWKSRLFLLAHCSSGDIPQGPLAATKRSLFGEGREPHLPSLLFTSNNSRGHLLGSYYTASA